MRCYSRIDSSISLVGSRFQSNMYGWWNRDRRYGRSQCVSNVSFENEATESGGGMAVINPGSSMCSVITQGNPLWSMVVLVCGGEPKCRHDREQQLVDIRRFVGGSVYMNPIFLRGDGFGPTLSHMVWWFSVHRPQQMSHNLCWESISCFDVSEGTVLQNIWKAIPPCDLTDDENPGDTFP